MFRIDSSGATIDNRFTEGDPSLSIPATVVSAKWLNHTQEEIIKTIEEMGLVLSDADEGLHYKALLEFFLRGGRKLPYKATIANNTGPVDTEDLNNSNAVFSFDKTVVKAWKADVDIERKTDTQNVQETGILYGTYDTNDDEWIISLQTVHGDAGTVITTAAVDANVSKLQYTSGDLTGTTYSGSILLTNVVEFRQ